MTPPTFSTDELLALLETKLPADFTADEIESLKAAAITTPAVRDALFETLTCEYGIAAVYGAELQGIDALFERLDAETHHSHRSWKVFGWVALIVLCLAGGAAVYLAGYQPQRVAQSDDPSDTPPKSRKQGRDANRPPREVPSQEDPPRLDRPEHDPEPAVDEVNPSDVELLPPKSVVSEHPSEPKEPPWRMYDDSSLRGDEQWRDSLNRVLRLISGSTARNRRSWKGYGYVSDVALRGSFAVVPPTDDGRTVRLRMSDVERLRWSFWHGDRDALVKWLPNEQTLRAFAVRRSSNKELPVLASGDRSNPRDAGAVQRVDPNIDFSWSEQPPPGELKGRRFSANWRGVITFPESGDWRLVVTTAGAVGVWIDDKQVLYRDEADSPEPVSGRVWYGYQGPTTKTPRTAKIRIEYTDATDGGIRMQWRRQANKGKGKWDRPEIPQQVVPAAAFRSDAKDAKQGLVGSYFPDPDADVLGPTEVLHLIDDDRGMWQREYRAGAIDVRYEVGAVRIMRGDVELLTLPMNEPPETFIMEANCSLQHAAVYQMPKLGIEERRSDVASTVEQHSPADWKWDSGGSGNQNELESHGRADGSLAFARSSGSESWQALTTIDRQRGFECTVKIDRASVGTGLMIVDPSNGERNLRLFIGQHEGSRVLCQQPTDIDDVRSHYERGWLIGDLFWVRCVVGLNDIRFEFSNNRVTWITADCRTFEASRAIDRLVRLGVTGTKGEAEQEIHIGAVQVRRFQGLEGLVAHDLEHQATELLAGMNHDSTDWDGRFDALIAARPENVNADQWEIANRLTMLSAETPLPQRAHHVVGLLEAAISGGLEWRLVEPALLELPRRFQLAKAPLDWRLLAGLYGRAAADYWPDPELRPRIAELADVWHRQLRGTKQLERPVEVVPSPIELGRLSLYTLAESVDPERLWMAASREYCLSLDQRGIENRNRSEDLPRLAQWMQLQSTRMSSVNQDDSDAVKPVATMFDRGRNYDWLRSLPLFHPLGVDSYSRDLQNLVQETRGAIDRGNWELAADAMIRDPLPSNSATGVSDDDVVVLLDVVVRQWLDRNPELAEAVRAKQQVGRVRLNRAIKHGDLALLESVALQFHCTEVGNAAESRLASRELSMREFLRAGQRYRRLAVDEAATEDQRHQWGARYRLAMALAGREVGQPVTGPVAFSGSQLSAQQFEKMVAASLGSRQLPAGGANSSSSPLAPAASSYAVAAKTSIDGVGQSAWEHVEPLDFGWAVEGNDLYVNQPGQLVAYALDSGAKQFASQATKAQDNWLTEYTTEYARPLVMGPYIIASMYHHDGFRLRCLVRDSGAAAWHQGFDDTVLGEPAACDGTILVLSLKKESNTEGVVILRRVDPRTGATLLSKRIASVGLSGVSTLRIGRPIIYKDNILLRSGGGVICCDLLGRLRWVRQLPFVPRAVEWERIDSQIVGDLCVADDRVVIASAGSWNVECRDVATGKRHWIYAHPDLQRLIGQAKNCVVVGLREEIQAIDMSDGRLLWRKPWRGNLDRLLLNEAGELLVPQRGEVQRYSAIDGRELGPLEIAGNMEQALGASRTLTDGRRLFVFRTLSDSRSLELTVLEPEKASP